MFAEALLQSITKGDTAVTTITSDFPEKGAFIANGVSFNMILILGEIDWKGAQKDNTSERNFDVVARQFCSMLSAVIGETFRLVITPKNSL